jgi:catechol 2,3-dioxygenase-like lactoylglutathione lyase family enzyme
MIKTNGLRHININVSDVKRSLEFYRQVFGMEEMFREGGMVFLTTPGGDDTITLCAAGANDPVGGGGVTHFGWTIDRDADLGDAAKQIEHAGGKVLRRGEHEPGHPFLYLNDPDGYVIAIFTR